MNQTKCFFLATLLGIGMITFTGPNEDLITACKQGDLATVQAALDAGADISATDASGNTAICYAFFWPEITKLLLDKGADPNAGNYPPIINACNTYSTDNDYAMMIHYLANAKVVDWQASRAQLDMIFSDDAMIYQVLTSDNLGMEVYNKWEFINKITLPAEGLKNLEIIETNFSGEQISELWFRQMGTEYE